MNYSKYIHHIIVFTYKRHVLIIITTILLTGEGEHSSEKIFQCKVSQSQPLFFIFFKN